MRIRWMHLSLLLAASPALAGCPSNNSSVPSETSNRPAPVAVGVDSEPKRASAAELGADSASRVDGNSAGVKSAEEAAAAAKDLQGNWKLVLAKGGEITQPWLIEISGNEDSYSVRRLDTSSSAVHVEVREFERTDDRVTFQVVFEGRNYPFDGVIAGQKIRGCQELPGDLMLAWLERTSQKTLRSVPLASAAPGAESYREVLTTTEPKERAKKAVALMDAYPESAMAFECARIVLRVAKEAELTEADVRGHIAKYEKLAQPWGQRWSAAAGECVAFDLANADLFPAIALEYAEKAKAALSDDASEFRRFFVDLGFSIALLRNDKAAEAKEQLAALAVRRPDDSSLRYFLALADEKLDGPDAAIERLIASWPEPRAARELQRIWKERHGGTEGLEERLDKAYLQRVPSIGAEPYDDRRDNPERVVVGELFTGTSVVQSKASEIAFDALLKTFRRSQLVLLQYHLLADPMTNADAQARWHQNKQNEVLVFFVDGVEASIGGGVNRQDCLKRFGEYRAAVEAALEVKSSAKIDLSARRDGDTVTIDVKVHDVAKPGDKLRLRLALVEDEVRYTGSSDVRLHHAVVRAMPGGPEGIPIRGDQLSHSETVRLADLKSRLSEWLTEREKEVTEKVGPFEFQSRPMDFKRLAVVAFVQDDATGAVLQAAYAPLDAEPAKSE